MTDVVEDLSAFVISGRVKSQLHGDPEHETSERTPAQGVADGVEAERLGFARVWLAERPELKEPATILGGIAARTSSSDGPICSFITAAPDMICPGVQYPHWNPS